MPIARINEFNAGANQGDALHALLLSFAAVIRGSDGCLEVAVQRARDDPDQTVIYEVWESVDHHRAAAGKIPADAVNEVVSLLSTPPRGEYYDVG